MPVISFGFAVSLVTLYIINRVGQSVLAFERIFFIGLKYCMEPSPADLAAVAATSVGAAAFVGTKATAPANDKISKAKKRSKQASGPAAAAAAKKAKATPADLPIVRAKLHENMFVGEPQLPKGVEFAYMCGMVSSFVIAYLVEDGVMCMLPQTAAKFSVSQTHWFGALIFLVSMYELLSMTRSMSSGVIVCVPFVIGTVFALAVIANGDSENFFLLDSAFANINAWAVYIHVERLSLPAESAPKYARMITTAARIGTGAMAGLLFASTAVPARRFGALDYDLLKRYVRDVEEEKADVYALPKPSQLLMLALALDYLLPIAVLASFAMGRPADPLEPYTPWRIVSLVAVVVLRLSLSRVRLQTYLDTGVTQYRNFWAERRSSPGSDFEAGQRLRTRAVTVYYYISTLGSLYIFGPVVGLMLALIAKRSGDLKLGVCSVAALAVERMSLTVAAREIFSFLAWYYFAAYALFSTFSFAFDTLVERFDPPQKMPSDVVDGISSSDRRKLRRQQEQKGNAR